MSSLTSTSCCLTTPSRLISQIKANETARALYTLCNVHFVTNNHSKSGMTHPMSGVNLVLVNAKNEASLHYISRISDDTHSRFEAGNTDNVDLILPVNWAGTELSQIWVSPEEGTWRLQEMVLIMHDDQQLRFECNQLLGTDDTPAAILTKYMKDDFNVHEYESSMRDYNTLRSKMLIYNTIILVTGTLFGYISNRDMITTTAFMEGGIVGVLYLYLLCKQTDYIGGGPGEKTLLLLPLVSGPMRLFLISYATVSLDILPNPRLLLPYTLGFFTYKVAVILAGISKTDLK